MNGPESSNQFVPKQAIAPTPELYAELVGDGMENLARVSLTHAPSLQAGSVIHDNGCGVGAGTVAVMDAVSKASISVSIKGTDINQEALDIYSKLASEHGWPVEALNMDSNALSFPDGTFTHSISNALVFVLPGDAKDALKEIHRTLKPGGVAIINSMAYIPNMEPIRVASKLTRPEGTPPPRQFMDKWFELSYLQNAVDSCGFESGNVKFLQDGFSATTVRDFTQFANMLWSFIGGTTSVGWLKSDEENWDKAIEIIKQELRKTEGFQELDDGRVKLRFRGNIAIAKK